MKLVLISIFLFVFINLITFGIWGRDKWKAKKQQRRISEQTLLILSFCGGRIGAIGAISFFRHKTIKSRFLWKFYLIGFLRILTIVSLLYLFS